MFDADKQPMPPGGLPVIDLVADDYIGWQEFEADHLAGTSRLQPVGGTWQFRSLEAIATRLKLHLSVTQRGLANLSVVKLRGIGKLLNVSTSADKSLFDIDIAVDTNMEQAGKGTLGTQLAWNLRLPGDGSTGPVKKACKLKFNTEILLPGLGPAAKIKATVSVVQTYDIKYGLSGDTPSPKIPVARGKPRVVLDDFKVAWVDGKPVLKVAAKYVFKDGLTAKPVAGLPPSGAVIS